MFDAFETFDPGLFGTWGEDESLMDAAQGVLLEVKSAQGAAAADEAPGDMRAILNAATLELRQQFETFRGLRATAEVMLQSGDEAAQKLARADIKAAIDAMSLIVRTLEKIDTLQRQFARDRQAEAERVADEGGYREAKARVLEMIRERVDEKAYRLFEEWRRDGPPDAVARRLAAETSEPEDPDAGGEGAAHQGDATAAGMESGAGDHHRSA
jgi:hypothetical protein